jgi:hypothetical protein
LINDDYIRSFFPGAWEPEIKSSPPGRENPHPPAPSPKSPKLDFGEGVPDDAMVAVKPILDHCCQSKASAESIKGIPFSTFAAFAKVEIELRSAKFRPRG